MRIEHPTGFFDCDVITATDPVTESPTVVRSAVIRTARKLFDGTTFAGPSGTKALKPPRLPTRKPRPWASTPDSTSRRPLTTSRRTPRSNA